MRSKFALTVLAGVALVAVGAVVVAASGRGSGSVDARAQAWTDADVTTTSKEWATIRPLRTRTGCQGNDNASATVSLELAEQSDPVQVRVRMDPLAQTGGEQVLNPSAVPFAAEGASSYTFVGETPGKGGSFFRVQWRIDPDVQGEPSATLTSGTLDVLWKKLGGKGPVAC